MPFLQSGQDATITVAATQSIRVGALQGATAIVTIPDGNRGAPVTTITDGQSVIGPFPNAVTLSVLSAKGVVEYVTGATPVLTNQLYDPSAVAITGGTINGTGIGATTRAGVATTLFRVSATDSTGTPGNVTNNSPNGRAAFAAAGTTVVVTNSQVAAADTVLVTLQGVADATLTAIVGVTVAAGSFTVTGNAAATATKGFMFLVIKV